MRDDVSMKHLNKTHQALVMIITFLAPSIGLGSGATPSPKVASDLDQAFIEAAESNQIDLKLIRALCWIESSHKVRAKAIFDQKNLNKKGATSYGVCQIQYETAKWMGYSGTAKQLMNPHTNTYYAAKMLKYWLVKSKGNWQLAVSAYNRGHYKKSLRVAYVAKIGIAMYENR